MRFSLSPRLLTHPVVLVALALWGVNDHLLKAEYPGWVTGKLSDLGAMIAGPVLLFAWMELLLPEIVAQGRRAALTSCALAAGATLAIINLSSHAARVYEVAIGIPQWMFWSLVSWSAQRSPLELHVLHTMDRGDVLVAPAAWIPLFVAARIWRHDLHDRART